MSEPIDSNSISLAASNLYTKQFHRLYIPAPVPSSWPPPPPPKPTSDYSASTLERAAPPFQPVSQGHKCSPQENDLGSLAPPAEPARTEAVPAQPILPPILEYLADCFPPALLAQSLNRTDAQIKEEFDALTRSFFPKLAAINGSLSRTYNCLESILSESPAEHNLEAFYQRVPENSSEALLMIGPCPHFESLSFPNYKISVFSKEATPEFKNSGIFLFEITICRYKPRKDKTINCYQLPGWKTNAAIRPYALASLVQALQKTKDLLIYSDAKFDRSATFSLILAAYRSQKPLSIEFANLYKAYAGEAISPDQYMLAHRVLKLLAAWKSSRSRNLSVTT